MTRSRRWRLSQRRFRSSRTVTGWVTGCSIWTTRPGPQALTYTRGEALGLAEDGYRKLVPAELGDALRFVDVPLTAGNFGDATYRFYWERMEQGRPVDGEGGAIAIDARSGDLTDYSLTWRHGRTFAAPGAVRERARVDAALRPHLGMTLQYRYFFDPETDEGERQAPGGRSWPSMPSPAIRCTDGGVSRSKRQAARPARPGRLFFAPAIRIRPGGGCRR